MGQIIAYSGVDGTGKMISVYRKAANLQTEHPDKRVTVLCNLESRCPFPGGSQITPEALMWEFSARISAELSMSAEWDFVVTDHTIVDVIARAQVAGFDSLANNMVFFAESYMSAYSEIRFKTIQSNSFWRPDIGQAPNVIADRLELEQTMEALYGMLAMGTRHQCGRVQYA